MQVRKIRVSPEDEARLWELLRVYEAVFDGLSDEQITAAEGLSSERLLRLVNGPEASVTGLPISEFICKNKGKSLLVAVAAATALILMSHQREANPRPSRLVSKGISSVPAISCEAGFVESDGSTPDLLGSHYLVKAGRSIHLRLRCSQPVFVHLGRRQGGMLHLELSNLNISSADKVVMQGIERVDVARLVPAHGSLMLLVTDRPLNKAVLTAEEQTGQWLEELPIAIRP